MKTEEEVCFSSSRIDEVDVSFQGRINEIEEGSFLDNVTITDYVLKSDTFQTLLLFAKSWSLALSFVLLWKQECMECFQGLLPKFGTGVSVFRVTGRDDEKIGPFEKKVHNWDATDERL